MKSLNGFSDKNPHNCDGEAILVHNAWKSYNKGQNIVLNGLNMSVNCGEIYAIIGASGCGKTTLLSSIVGTRALDRGQVRVFGNNPGSPQSGIPGRRIGYMPQDLSIYPELKIKELLEYFGRIYGLTEREISSRVTTLSQFLDLPKASRIIASLSGGQKRRISLAVALIHEPPLLILDEPTVGVDPLLRQSIWNHLEKLVSKQQTTVLITTHYIEEARNSHKVGIMRNGMLLAEKCPHDLIYEHQAINLEDVVLKLCKKDAEVHALRVLSQSHPNNITVGETYPRSVVGLSFKPISHSEIEVTPVKGSTKAQTIPYQKSNPLQKIKAVTVKNAKLFSREVVMLLATIVMPVMNLTLGSLTIGGEPKHLKFGVVNPEVNYDISQCGNFSGSICTKEDLSCNFIQAISQELIILVSTKSAGEALQDVEQGKTLGFMEFPNGYTNSSVERYAFANFVDNETLERSTISLRMDLSGFITARAIQNKLLQAFQSSARKRLQACGESTYKTDVPLNFRKPIYGRDDEFSGNVDTVVLSISILIQIFIPLARCLNSIILDKGYGTLERAVVAGANMNMILIGYMIVHGLNNILQAVICFYSIKLFFIKEMLGSDLDAILLLILAGLTGISFSFLLSEMYQEIGEAFPLTLGAMLTSFDISGLKWPVEAFPNAVWMLAHCLPYAWPMYSLKAICLKGWPMWHPKVWPAYAILLGWIVGFWGLARITKRLKT